MNKMHKLRTMRKKKVETPEVRYLPQLNSTFRDRRKKRRKKQR